MLAALLQCSMRIKKGQLHRALDGIKLLDHHLKLPIEEPGQFRSSMVKAFK